VTHDTGDGKAPGQVEYQTRIATRDAENEQRLAREQEIERESARLANIEDRAF